MAEPEKKRAVPKTSLSEGFLNTGLSSAVQRRHARKMEELKKKRAAASSALTPQADVILEWVKKEKADTADMQKKILMMDVAKIRTLVPLVKQLDVDNKDLLTAQVIAIAMHLEWLNGIEKKINNVLRKAEAAVKDGETFEDEE